MLFLVAVRDYGVDRQPADLLEFVRVRDFTVHRFAQEYCHQAGQETQDQPQ